MIASAIANRPVDDDPILAVDGLSFSYGSLQVLFDISVSVARGEALALLGTNGAGKSTFLRVVAGLERPAQGSVTLDGQNIAGLPAERVVRKGLALVPGGQAVFPDLTVDENLNIMGFTLRGQGGRLQAKKAEALDFFPQLRSRTRQLAWSLSGGEQQQLALAKALLLEPRVLCIDEMSLGLAPSVVESLLSAVKEIHQAGVTLVVVEQSLNIAAALCPRCIFLEKGRTRFEGSTASLLADASIARAVFFGDAPQVE